MRPLTELMQNISDVSKVPSEALNLSITSVTSDSRQAIEGTLFVAIKGNTLDGTAFIEPARKAGAVAVLCDQETSLDIDIPVIHVANPRVALSCMAAIFYDHQPAHMVAVTGTDGKTSTADFFRQFWYKMGKNSASLGTLGMLSGSDKDLYPGLNTTPDPVTLHKALHEIADQGVDYVCLEASSHGLDQYRLDGVRLEAAAFTNLARDHLDYHKTEEQYFQAKKRLFSEVLSEGSTVVLNYDDARFSSLRALCEQRQDRIISFGRNGGDFHVLDITPHAQGQTVQLVLFGKVYAIEVPMVGGFQVMNILTALGLVVATGGELEEALSFVPSLKGVPGRLEQIIQLSNGATVFIDYAHTPMALANILKTLRVHTQHKLHVVFGCGGDRDKGKRPDMGRYAQELADRVVVTDDNPRTEDPAAIRQDIMEAASGAKEVADRKEAIYVAMQALQAGDVLVVAGKGHEKTQTVGDHTYPFDDAQIIRELAGEMT